MMRSPESVAGDTEPGNEIDLRALGGVLKRRRGAVLIPTAIAFVLVTMFVNIVSPRYTGEAQVLLENQETFFTRPDRVNVPVNDLQVDQEGVASQVQLVQSPDIARRAIKDLDLSRNPEFDPLAHMNPLSDIMGILGLSRDRMSDSAEERVTQAFLQKLTVYSPPKTRVITIQFVSKDPELAARAANQVAELYIEEQSTEKRALAKNAADALAAQIADLRVKLSTADAERESYRLQSGLLAGTNNMTITGQQLADINGDLSKARSIQADAQAKAAMIRELLRNGNATSSTDVINNDIVRRIWDARSTAQAQLALEARTLLPGHPRIKALQAQVDEYDAALKAAAKQAAVSLENEAKIAGSRVENLETVLKQQKKEAGASNGDEVHLRALERTTQSYKDQLESSTAKYQEALARESSDATPADARIISRAVEPEEPSFPKKLPFILFGTTVTLVLSVGFVVVGELLSDRSEAISRPASAVVPRPTEAASSPSRASERLRQIADEEGPDLAFAPVRSSGRPASKAGLVASVTAYLKSFGLSAADSRVFEAPAPQSAVASSGLGWDVPVPATPKENDATTFDVTTLANRIVAAHVPGRGLHIVGTSLGNEPAATAIILDLGRTLAGKGRSVIVDLNRTPTKLASLCEGTGDGRATILTMNGLSELLAGSASFAEVIHRDHLSRLHFIPTGHQQADFRDFDLILDALSETYDFVMLLAPAFPQSEIAKVMAPYADFVMLTTVAEPDHKMVGMLETELLEAGAREVLVAGRGAVGAGGSSQSIA